MFLPLAQKMVEKFVNENKIDAEAGIKLNVFNVVILLDKTLK